MTDAIIVAIISGCFTLAGVIIGVLQAQKKTENTIKTNLAVMETRMDELTREVRTHNGFAQRLPIIEEQIKGLDRRITGLENKNGND